MWPEGGCGGKAEGLRGAGLCLGERLRLDSGSGPRLVEVSRQSPERGQVVVGGVWGGGRGVVWGIRGAVRAEGWACGWQGV